MESESNTQKNTLNFSNYSKLEKEELLKELFKFKEELLITKEELSETKEELKKITYIFSHDFNGPLRGISYLTRSIESIIESENLKADSEVNEKINQLKERTTFMGSQIEGLLKYHRLMIKDNNYSRENLNKIIQSIKIQLEKIKPDININVKISQPNMIIDFDKIFTVFNNIMHNSIQFNDKEICSIEISDELLNNSTIKFTIKDNGPGIPEKFHVRVFDIFQKYKYKSDGPGIGLSIAKKAIEQHKGKIWIDSNFKSGLSINFTLPIFNQG